MPHWLFHLLGMDGGSIYDLISGWIADASIFTAAFSIYWKHTCHTGWRCWRIARHPYDMDGTTYQLCRVHHPTARKIRHHHILAHQAAMTGASDG